MSETGVELPSERRAPRPDIRMWCESTLAGVLSHDPRDVLFDAYVHTSGTRCDPAPGAEAPGLHASASTHDDVDSVSGRQPVRSAPAELTVSFQPHVRQTERPSATSNLHAVARRLTARR